MDSITLRLRAAIIDGQPTFVLHGDEPIRQSTTEGDIAMSLFSSEASVRLFYDRDMRANKRLHISTIPATGFRDWLADTIQRYNISRIAYDPDPTKDVGNYLMTPAVLALGFLPRPQADTDEGDSASQ